MIVLNSRNAWVKGPVRPLPFGGTVGIFVPVGEPMPADLIAALPEEPFIFELAPPGSSTLDQLRSLLLQIAKRGLLGPEPLIFLGEGAPAAAMAKAIGPDKVEWRLTQGGDLEMLICGSKIVQAPLFRTFFENMAPGMAVVHTKTSMDLFEQFFGTADA